jgi:hypothetical protein
MAATPVNKYENVVGGLKEKYIDLDGLASYTTGGQTLTAGDCGFRYIFAAEAGAGDNAAHHCAVVHATKGPVTSVKVMWFVASTGAELAAAQNVSARFTRVRVLGY